MKKKAETDGFELLIVVASGSAEIDTVIAEHDARGWEVERIVPAREDETASTGSSSGVNFNEPHSPIYF